MTEAHYDTVTEWKEEVLISHHHSEHGEHSVVSIRLNLVFKTSGVGVTQMHFSPIQITSISTTFHSVPYEINSKSILILPVCNRNMEF